MIQVIGFLFHLQQQLKLLDVERHYRMIIQLEQAEVRSSQITLVELNADELLFTSTVDNAGDELTLSIRFN